MNKEAMDARDGGWVAYRPEIKILDCTVRDGGLINNHNFDDDFVRAIYQTCVKAGIDYMEFGYKGSKSIYSPTNFGKWKYCEEEDLRRIVGDNPTQLKIVVMADAERTDYKTSILPKKDSVIDCVRVATYIHQIPTAIEMVLDAHEKGYETFLQLMAVSTLQENDVRDALKLVARTPVGGISLVDSFGSLYTEQVRNLARIYLDAMGDTGKQVGFHGHNNQQMAFANTVEAVVAGVNRLDATIMGLGRGAGNCPLELLLGFLHNPKFDMRPVLECCQKVLLPLARKMEWGYSIPYAITGQLNRHPSAAIEWRGGKTPDDYVGFYDRVMEEES